MTYDPNQQWQPNATQPPSQAGSGHGAAQPYGYGKPQPSGAPAPMPAASGSTTTRWIWWALACSGVSLLVVAFMPWHLYIDGMAKTVSGTTEGAYSGASMIMQFTMWTMVLSVVSMLVSAGFYVFAYLDWRDLGRNGVQQPFHWAFAFLGVLVYTIGRTVVLKSRGRPSPAPLWVAIGLTAVSLAIATVILVITFGVVFSSIQAVR